MIAGIACLSLGLWAVVIAIDPFDTGRFALAHVPGVRTSEGPRTAGASRGRDAMFNAAIVGNSHMQLIEPAALDRLASLQFVSLVVPASGPKEQLTLIEWFARHHPTDFKAVVVGIDHTWCTADAALPPSVPFPFWLYEASSIDYVVGLFRYRVVEHLPEVLRQRYGRSPRARPDGYADYEPTYLEQGYGDAAKQAARLAATTNVAAGERPGDFPAATAFAASLGRLPAQLRVIMVRPPVYITALPASEAERAGDDACRARFETLAAARPHTTFLNYQTDRPETRDIANFFDHTHYRKTLAKIMEPDIARAFATMQ